MYKISALTPSKLSTLIPDDATSESAISVITFVLIRFLLPFCSSLAREREEVPVSGTSSIIDVGGVGLSRFWGLRSHLQVRSFGDPVVLRRSLARQARLLTLHFVPSSPPGRQPGR